MRNAPNISERSWPFQPAEVAARWPIERPLLWLHSGRAHRRWARWSIMASPRAIFRFAAGESCITGESLPELQHVRLTNDPLRDLDAVLAATAVDGCATAIEHVDLPFRGGWIGFFSYDLGRVIEPKAQRLSRIVSGNRHAGWPLVELAWCPDALVFDHVRTQWFEIEDRDSPSSRATARSWTDAARDGASAGLSPLRRTLNTGAFHLGAIESDIPPEHYRCMVARTIEHIEAGDIFQANIAQRFRAPLKGSTRALAIEAFRKTQPWYGAYLEFAAGDTQRRVLSLSPELFLQVEPRTRQITTRPIKGTRPATLDAAELLHSEKDEAELNMIVDLMRNDLGRICEYGSIHLPAARVIESHPTVHHGVAEIAGTLREGTSLGTILRATFPPGSVTGAPKIRAMQIIDELERHSPACAGSTQDDSGATDRGVYCGAIGFINDCGGATLNVAIRTLSLEGRSTTAQPDRWAGTATYHAGAGIVADSNPQAEYEETLAKTAVVRALANAAGTLEAPFRAFCT